MSDETSQLSIGLLGPLAASIGDTPVTPSAPKQRQVLALLALYAGRVVTVSTLVEELWGDRPPRSYPTTLQTYIFQLRKSLSAALSGAAGGPEGRSLLMTSHSGYLLDRDCRVDVTEFERFAQAGRAAAEAGDYRAASRQLSRALQVWRGPALVDVPTGSVLEIEAASLEETRLGVLERRIAADLALDRHGDILGELTLNVAKNPMNEILTGFLMIALYRSGHVARSLEVFQQLRSVLMTELGIEPCTKMRRLQAAILTGDPILESPSITSLGNSAARS
jgi:DNA-binding SARP family transcriptional activator